MVGNEQWKKRERKIGADLGVQRIPSSGRPMPDLIVPPGEMKAHPGVAIESKCWAGIPPKFWQALDQARKNAHDGMIPVAVISESNRVRGRTPRFAVVIDYDAFVALFAPDAATEAAIAKMVED